VNLITSEWAQYFRKFSYVLLVGVFLDNIAISIFQMIFFFDIRAARMTDLHTEESDACEQING